ncbi:MAG: DUF559 domain-containing protein [Candidatus Gracilibacteria bacterium]|nr:DUF559 domain-containing protein [Candidatus Gracilibacteria bacterium]
MNGYFKRKNLISGSKFFPYNPKLKDRASEMRKNQTPSELKLWKGFLQNFNKRGENKITILRQKIIDNYIVDFYIHSKKLIIEIDGEIHNNRGEYDNIRTEILEGYGLKIIRFSNNEISYNFEEVCKKIELIIKKEI